MNSSSIHDIAHLATELTCQVASLGSVWLLAIKALSTCTPPNRQSNAPNHTNVFEELRRIDVCPFLQKQTLSLNYFFFDLTVRYYYYYYYIRIYILTDSFN